MHTSLLATRLCRWLAVAAFGLLAVPAAHAQLVGTQAIPSATYPTVAAAIAALNTSGVGTGGVTFNIAAGYTETAANLVLTATGTAANPIVFQKSGTGANPLITAGVGTSTTVDAVIALAGSDYVTFNGLDLAESASNTTATTQMEFGYELARASATDGAQYNTIRNCVVTLNKTNANTIGIAGVASTTANTTAVPATSPAGANSYNKVYGNVVTNALTGIYFAAGSATTTANYDQNNEIGSIISPATTATGNVIGNFGGSASAYGAGGTYQNGLKIQGNTINSTLNYTSATASTAVAASTVTSTLRGIYTPSGTSSSLDILNNTITLASGATTSQLSGIENGMGSTAASNTVNITGNTLTNSTYTTATSATIYSIYNTASAATINITGNTITGNNFGGTASASMACYGVYNTGAGTTANLSNNSVTNNTIAGSGTVALMYGGSPANLNITNNTITGNTKTGGVTTTGSFFCIQALTTVATVTGNTVNNNSIAATGTTSASLYGYYDLSSPTAETITNNTFTNLSIGGASTATAHTVAGIYSNPIAGTAKNYSQNTIGNLAATPGGTVYGIYTVTGATVTISSNKIYALSAGASTGLAYGLYISSGVTVTASNNLIGDVQAAASTSLLGVAGVYVGGGTTVNAYFNTIYLNASSSGATFGTSGIYLASTTTALDLRNNIVVNKSTAAGTGGSTAALRRVSGTAGTAPANLASTTNNNLYYAGAPSATNLIYTEGTTTQTNATQTLAAYKTLVAQRESNSVTEDVPFLSTTGTAATFLHISTTTPTQVESAGVPVSGITTDFDGDTRNANYPDLGADEGTFVLQDLTGPTIAFTTLANTSSTANRTLTVTITDVSGISTTTPPRLFYRKGTSGAFTSALATSVSGSQYTFTLNYTALGGVTAGDAIQYYVVAQDVPGNVSSNPVGNTFTTPASIYSYTILSALNGIYYVGTGTPPTGTPADRVFATLTLAASAYSGSGMSGPVTFLLMDNAYSATTGETFPVVFFNNVEASATNTLLIKPAPGANPVVTAAGSVLALASTRYVTIDGSNAPNGTTRNLTLTNTAITASSYGLGLLTQSGLAQSNQFATVRNVNVVGGGTTTNATLGIVLSGADNDNVTLQNNSIQGVTTGIQAFGSTNVSVGGLDNLVITDNVVGPATAAAATTINQYGIVVASALSPVVSRNEVQNIVNPTATFAANMTGILLQDVQTGIISRNSIHNLSYTGTSTAKLYGISTQISTSTFNTAGNASAIRFDNNLVYALNSTASSASWNTSGINNNGGYGDQYYYNTVYLSGQLSTGTAGSAAFSNGNGISSTAAANIDVRNNIFSIIGGTGAATTPLYAHYTTLANYTGSTLNYNDLYVTTGANGVARIGRLNGTDATTLADWRTATGQEANSISADPLFAQTTAVPYDLTPANVALNNVGTPITGVTFDYLNTTRGALPDIGAYEFTPLTADLAPVALVAPATGITCYGPAEAVSVSIRNAGTSTLNFATTPATVTVVVTPPTGPAQTLTATVNTGTLASNATQTVTLNGTLNMTAVGTYSFAVSTALPGDGNASNDVLTPAPTRTVTAPVAGTAAASNLALCISGTTTLTLTGSANGSIQWQQSTDNTTFTDISGANAATYTTPVLTSTTYYRARTSCNTNVATSNVLTITVSNPQVLTVTSPVVICAGGSTTLAATTSTGATARFFSAATGGTALASATVSPTTATTYYAEAVVGSQENVGKALTNGADGTNTAGGLYFTTTGATTIATVTVYRTANAAAGTATINLIPGSSTTVANAIATVTVPVPANTSASVSPTVLTLNMAVPAAGSYTLYLSAASPSLIRDYTSAVPATSYPYTSPSGLVSITGATLSGYYYFFFNWQIGSECASATRTPIQVNVNPAPTASFPAATATSCGTSPYTLGGTVGGSATTGTYTTSGTGTFSPNATTLNATYTPSAADVAAGTVTLTLTSNATSGCTPATAQVVLTLNQPSIATFSYPTTATYCAGSASTVTPTLGTGATAGTFSSTTGLTINATTGAITLATSTAGTYTVTNTIAATGSCPAATATATVTVAPAATAAFSYAATTYCASGTNPTPTITGTAGGTFTSTAGLTLSATTGAITLSSSTPGTYTVTYTAGTVCTATATQTVTITAAPVASFSYPTVSICTSQTTATAPTLATGATAGTFSSTTGLSLNATTGAITPATSTAGTYTVTNTVAASGGCAAATATTTVTITAPQVATFSYATAATCAGSTATVAPTLATGATAGTFSSTTGLTINATTGVISPATSTAGTYTVTNTLAASGGCAAVTATSTFTVNPLPATPTVTVTYPTTSTALLTSSAAPAGATYQWYLNAVAIAGATSQTYTANGATAPGAYSLCIINTATGCRSCSGVTTVTASAQPLAGTSLRLFPNPTSDGQVTLQLSGYTQAVQLTVLDALGRVVLTQQVAAGQAQARLDLTGAATGVYLLRATTQGGTDVLRIVRH